MYFLNTLWQKIIQFDHDLFTVINSKWTNSFFDAIMPLLRNSIIWIPLYLFILIFVFINFKSKAMWWIVFFLITVALTDMTGTHIFKYGFDRVRPCNNPDIIPHLRLLVRCPVGYSFTSNHAANHFGMAMFLFLTLRHHLKNWMLIAFLWAGIIGYAQVYVGVHYPSDIAGGMALGIIYGTISAFVYNKYFGLSLPEENLN
jgi:membrane-associated phospholipid phosphatase